MAGQPGVNRRELDVAEVAKTFGRVSMPLSMTRRELVTLVCGAAAATGCDAVGRWSKTLPPAGRLLTPDHAAGHRLRAGGDGGGSFDWQMAENLPRRTMPVVIVGGGVAGLAAGMELNRLGMPDFQILELESMVGGTAVGGQASLPGGGQTAMPWGAHYLPVPAAANVPLVRWLASHGIVDVRGDRVIGAERYLVRSPAERVFAGGRWHAGLIPPTDDPSDRHRFETEMVRFADSQGDDGRPHFMLPRSLETREPTDEIRRLDTISMADWLSQNHYNDAGLRGYLDHACRDDYGLPADQTSAWAGIFYFAARISPPDHQPAEIMTWPAGNGFLVDRLRADCGDRIAAGQMVLASRRRGTTIELATDAAVWVADQVIFATPAHVTAAIVPPGSLTAMPPKVQGSWWVANVTLSGRPAEPDFPLCWDNVIAGSRSLGYVVATHQTGSDHGPTVWTWYRAMTGDPPAVRRRLLSLTWAEVAEAVLSDLEVPHSDIRSLVMRIDAIIWGHAMVAPVVGSMLPLGQSSAEDRIDFAASDLSGVALFEEAFDHGVRAAGRVAVHTKLDQT